MNKNDYACNGVRIALYKKILIFFGIFLICLSVAFFPLSLGVDNSNVALASSTNGVVENNIFTNPSFIERGTDLGNVGTSSGYLNIRYWDGVFSIDETNYTVSLYENSSDSYFILLFKPSDAITYTFTVSYSGTSISYCRLRSSSWSTLVSGNVSNNIVTFSYTFNSSQLNDYYFIQCGGGSPNTTLTLNWVKVEKGNEFTGFVPLNYENYGYLQGFGNLNYQIWNYTNSNSIGSIGANLDKDEMNKNTYDISKPTLRIYSVDNASHSYSSPVNCAFYYVFSGTLTKGAMIKIDWNFNVSFNGTQTIFYRFAETNSSLTSDEVIGNSDGTFTNNSGSKVLFVPRDTSTIYFGVRVNATTGFSGAGGLPYYYLYMVQNNLGYTIYANSLPEDTDLVSNAYKRGYDDGKEDGIIIGQQDHPYSFKGLFSAIYSVPINAFNNMFNFTVFGVNLRTFILGMITFALALFVWKIIVRGG